MTDLRFSAGLEFRLFDVTTATQAEFVALNNFISLLDREAWPHEPVITAEERARGKRALPSFEEHHSWVLWRGSNEIVAWAYIHFIHASHNQYAANIFLEVHPELRRLGIARGMLRVLADIARQNQRTLLFSWTSGLLPAGEAFMTKLGGTLGQVNSVNDLEIAGLNHEAVARWLARAQPLRSEFDLGLWDGPYPEEHMADVIEMAQVMNTMPRGELQIEDETWTAEQLREEEDLRAEQQIERWTLYVRHRDSGRMAGYTQVFWKPSVPYLVRQGDTGVFPEWRRRGLGTWLKAEMIQRVLRDRPQATLVRTFNAAANAEMVSINQQMGFRERGRILAWQVSLDRVESYLKQHT